LIRTKKLTKAAKPISMFSSLIKKPRIHPIAVIFSYLAAVFLLSNCEDESPRPRSYPRINTMPVSEITANGAVFNGELYSLGTEVIINYGFVWSPFAPDIKSSNKILLGTRNVTGIFSAEIVTNLLTDKEYIVKSFVQTADHIVYGIPVKFKSLGSGAPQVTGFEPSIAAWEDTLFVRGKNFSWVATENIVKLNNTICPAVSSTDTTLKVLVSYELPDLKSVMSVTLAGNTGALTKDTFRLIPPVLKDFNPKQARWGDTVYIKGNKLHYLDYQTTNYIKLGTLKCKRLGVMTDSTVAITVPYEVAVLNNDLSINLNGFILQGERTLELLSPPPFKISPLEAAWGNSITLTGKFHPDATRNTFYFNSIQAPVVSESPEIVVLQVPNSLSVIKSDISYKVAPFTVTAADTFHLLPPEIISFSPVSGPSGTRVQITGKNFTGNKPVIKFGSTVVDPWSISFYNETTLEVYVPAMSNGPQNITVIYNGIPSTSAAEFNVTNTQIAEFFPLSGTFNDEILIKGVNFTPRYGTFTNVLIGNKYANIKSLNDSTIIANVPLETDSVPVKIIVQIGGIDTYSEENFVLTPPQILSFQPSLFSPGDEITVNGTGFCPGSLTLNKLFIDSYRLNIVSSTATEIKAMVPALMPRGNLKLTLITGGYKRSLPLNFEFNSQWFKIGLPAFVKWNPEGGVNSSGNSFSVRGRGYLLDYTNSNLISFDPATNEFSDLGTFGRYQKQQGLKSVVNNDTAYLIGGSVFDRYNSEFNSWSSLPAPPLNLNNGAGFSLSGRIYYGLQYDVNQIGPPNPLFWTFNQETNTWVEKASYPGFSAKIAISSFAIGNEGFVLFLDNIFCKYNSGTDTWSLLAPFPESGLEMYGSISFVLNNKVYVGLGKTYNSYPTQMYDDFWIYDPVTNIWTRDTVLPGGARYNSISFVINNKGYMGFGFNIVGNFQNDFYEFDPNYPLK
jgi:hypothetical protein